MHIFSTYYLITAEILEFNGQDNENNRPMTIYHDIHKSRVTTLVGEGSLADLFKALMFQNWPQGAAIVFSIVLYIV